VRVLVLNPGSSTLKASALDVRSRRGVPNTLATTEVDWGDDATRIDASAGIVAALDALAGEGVPRSSVDAVAHRVVHGGARFREPTVVDDRVLDALAELAPLAPLHNPVAVATIRAARRTLPDVPHVAVFDTAFHASLPESAWRYPVPRRWTDDWGVRRFGFHGLSVEWATERAALLLGERRNTLALVVAHLGSGCSVSAVWRGKSVATSMGMTPLEGLMMGTRAGSIDPGILLYVLREQHFDLDALGRALDHESGLLGVSGTTAGVRELVEAARGGDKRAGLALEMFVDRAAAGIAVAATSLPRIDALVFTGGIGEHAGTIRTQIVERLSVIGIRPVSPDESGKDRVLERRAGARGGPAVLRIEAREDVVAARHTFAALSASPRS
jgi:acetate kinase